MANPLQTLPLLPTRLLLTPPLPCSKLPIPQPTLLLLLPMQPLLLVMLPLLLVMPLPTPSLQRTHLSMPPLTLRLTLLLPLPTPLPLLRMPLLLQPTQLQLRPKKRRSSNCMAGPRLAAANVTKKPPVMPAVFFRPDYSGAAPVAKPVLKLERLRVASNPLLDHRLRLRWAGHVRR
ncbi:MAG: hypothetical protein SGI99_11970 [Pseudomonadota bacterium]|nr:hypothetical protein [Pseudomonadota bacterium]